MKREAVGVALTSGLSRKQLAADLVLAFRRLVNGSGDERACMRSFDVTLAELGAEEAVAGH